MSESGQRKESNEWLRKQARADIKMIHALVLKADPLHLGDPPDDEYSTIDFDVYRALRDGGELRAVAKALDSIRGGDGAGFIDDAAEIIAWWHARRPQQ